MDAFFIRIVVGCFIIWLTQVLLGVLEIKEPGNKLIFAIVVIIEIIYIAFGGNLVLVK